MYEAGARWKKDNGMFSFLAVWFKDGHVGACCARENRWERSVCLFFTIPPSLAWVEMPASTSFETHKVPVRTATLT